NRRRSPEETGAPKGRVPILHQMASPRNRTPKPESAIWLSKGGRETSNRTRPIKAISRTAKMPEKHPNTQRIGGPGASHENRKHPDKSQARGERPENGKNGQHSKVSG